MKQTLILLLLIVYWRTPVAAQSDTPETLQWIETQSSRIDTLLLNAVQGHDQLNIVLRIMDAYLIFDAIALAGVYCPGVREAAQEGRNQCDVLNYRLKKDMNSNITRAVEARLQANRMMQAARQCRGESVAVGFAPIDIIREDAAIVALDLSDGLAAEDFHILSQKIEHAIRLLYDIQHVSATLNNCQSVYDSAQKVINHSEAALGAFNWVEVNRSIAAALQELGTLPNNRCQ
jgi:hypothetical protein